MGRRQGTGVIRLLGVLLGSGLLLSGTTAQAARLMEIRVERDGQVMLKGMTEDDSQIDPGVVWGYLKGATLKPVGEVRSDPADPLRATLTGKIRVAVLHGGRPAGAQGAARTDVMVEELRLVRPSPDSDHWQLAPGEVERTAQAGGIQLPQPRWWLLAVAGGVGVVVLAAVGVWLVRRERGGVNPTGAEPASAPDRGRM